MPLPRLAYPSPKLSTTISIGLFVLLTLPEVVCWVTGWPSVVPQRIFNVALGVAVIFGVGGFLRGPLMEALHLGRRIQSDYDSRIH